MTRTLPPIPELTVDISDVATRVFVMQAQGDADPLESIHDTLEAGLREAFRLVESGVAREDIEVHLFGCYPDEEDEEPVEFNDDDAEALGVYFITKDGQIDVMDRTD